ELAEEERDSLAGLVGRQPWIEVPCSHCGGNLFGGSILGGHCAAKPRQKCQTPLFLGGKRLRVTRPCRAALAARGGGGGPPPAFGALSSVRPGEKSVPQALAKASRAGRCRVA